MMRIQGPISLRSSGSAFSSARSARTHFWSVCWKSRSMSLIFRLVVEVGRALEVVVQAAVV